MKPSKTWVIVVAVIVVLVGIRMTIGQGMARAYVERVDQSVEVKANDKHGASTENWTEWHPVAPKKFEAAQKLRTNGIQIGMAKGNSYGEPNVVWASSQMPGQHMVFAEFGMKMDDDRWLQGKPDPKMSAAQYEKMHWDCYFQGSILSREIIAVHEPWHQKYRYMLANDLIEKAKAGEYDMLLQNNEYGPAVYKAKHS